MQAHLTQLSEKFMRHPTEPSAAHEALATPTQTLLDDDSTLTDIAPPVHDPSPAMSLSQAARTSRVPSTGRALAGDSDETLTLDRGPGLDEPTSGVQVRKLFPIVPLNQASGLVVDLDDLRRGLEKLLPDLRRRDATLELTDLAERILAWSTAVSDDERATEALLEAASLLAGDAAGHARAVQVWREAIRRSPRSRQVVRRISHELNRKSAWAELEALLMVRAGALDGTSQTALRYEAWRDLGRVRAKLLKDTPGAILAYRTASAIMDTRHIHVALARLYVQRAATGDERSAAEHFVRAAERSTPEHAARYLHKALDCVQEFEPALSMLQRLGLTPGAPRQAPSAGEPVSESRAGEPESERNLRRRRLISRFARRRTRQNPSTVDTVVLPQLRGSRWGARLALSVAAWAGIVGAGVLALQFNSSPQDEPVLAGPAAATALAAAPVEGGAEGANAARVRVERAPAPTVAEPTNEVSRPPPDSTTKGPAPQSPAPREATPAPAPVALVSVRVRGARMSRPQLATRLEPTRRAVSRCLASSGSALPDRGLRLSWTVGRFGKPRRVRHAGNSASMTPVARCAARALRGTRFARPRGRRTARVTATFGRHRGTTAANVPQAAHPGRL